MHSERDEFCCARLPFVGKIRQTDLRFKCKQLLIPSPAQSKSEMKQNVSTQNPKTHFRDVYFHLTVKRGGDLWDFTYDAAYYFAVLPLVFCFSFKRCICGMYSLSCPMCAFWMVDSKILSVVWMGPPNRASFLSCFFHLSPPDVFFHSHNASDLSVKKRQHDSTVCTSSSRAISSSAARHACNEPPGDSNGGFDSVCLWKWE